MHRLLSIDMPKNRPERLDIGRKSRFTHRVTGGGRPPPVPTERSVQISRTTLFRR